MKMTKSTYLDTQLFVVLQHLNIDNRNQVLNIVLWLLMIMRPLD